jgi:hypothetical protein
MKYALLIYPGPARDAYNALPEDGQRQIFEEYMAIAGTPGVYATVQLDRTPAETATTVREDNGQTLITDGPFADTKEVLGGVFLLDAPNLDAALELAKRIPAVRMGGAVEIQRVLER